MTKPNSIAPKFVIERGLPISKKITRARSSMYPWPNMKDGDSIFVGGDQGKGAKAAACSWAKSHPQYRFATRKEGDGYRIWRIAVKS